MLRTSDDRTLAANNAVEDAFDDGLDYLELRYSPWFIAKQTGLDPNDVVGAVDKGASLASVRTGLPIGLIPTVARDFGPESANDQVRTILETRDLWCGIDLAGNEVGFPAQLFAPAFLRAREARLHITVHAGEAAGPESVAAAIDYLGAERIGRGVRSAEDPHLLRRLMARGTTLEVYLTSNTQTQASNSLANHQTHDLLKAGVSVTLNTDNPTTSSTRLVSPQNIAEQNPKHT